MKFNFKLPAFPFSKFPIPKVGLPVLGILILSTLGFLGYKSVSLGNSLVNLQKDKVSISEELSKTSAELNEIKNQDQVKINLELKANIKSIESTYSSVVSTYEKLLKLKESTDDTQDLDNLFTKSLVLLSKQNYTEAASTLATLNKQIDEQETKLAATVVAVPQNVPASNAPPGSGFSRQQVSSDAGPFMVSIVAADLGSTRVIVDTASTGTCTDNCPVLPLATYVSRNGAYAGVNGSYFCPASYPTCAGKTNSFDLLLMNKDKVYFNSDNNVYSNNPGVIFGGGYIRFVSAVSQWGRDTGIDSMLSNYPLLVSGGNISFGGDDDPKKGSKGNRSFVANKGNTVYIGVVHSATVAESARVMKALGMENALNLDDGGSTALWSGGYKVGPGRDLPNVILFVGK